MTYLEIIESLLEANHSTHFDFSLEHPKALNELLGCPTRHYPTVHIAGSNGKGSVSYKIAKALEYAGYRVGLYTSPHLFSFRERITINSEMISEEEVIEGMEELFALEKKAGIRATFFELTTFLAFLTFRKRAVDIAVIETGLGGRLDATNVIQPILTAITSISREHVHILARFEALKEEESLEKIAFEKAGILKEGVPLILGPKARFHTIYERAKELHCPIYISKKLSHFYDEENSAIAELALEQLSAQFPMTPDHLQRALELRPPCRFERKGDVIFDVAHNPDGVFSLLHALHAHYPTQKFRFVIGFCRDKEYDRCLELISNVATHIHLVQAATSRAATPAEMAHVLSGDKHSLHFSIEEGIESAITECQKKGELLVVTGSFYLMKDAHQFVNEKSFP